MPEHAWTRRKAPYSASKSADMTTRNTGLFASMEFRIMTGSPWKYGKGSIQEFPCICPIEPPDDDRLQNCGFKVPQVYSVTSTGRGFERLPVGNDAAGLAPDVLQRAITPDIAFRVLRVPLDGDRAKLVVRPYATRAPAQRAVTARRRFGRRRECKADRAAVAGTLQR